jgi:hypothetical protein
VQGRVPLRSMGENSLRHPTRVSGASALVFEPTSPMRTTEVAAVGALGRFPVTSLAFRAVGGLRGVSSRLSQRQDRFVASEEQPEPSATGQELNAPVRVPYISLEGERDPTVVRVNAGAGSGVQPRRRRGSDSHVRRAAVADRQRKRRRDEESRNSARSHFSLPLMGEKAVHGHIRHLRGFLRRERRSMSQYHCLDNSATVGSAVQGRVMWKWNVM